jgi:hypothetical protein
MRTVIAALVVVLVAPASFCDWVPGDPHKMHYPQLPDPNGWDVYVPPWLAPTGLADDWQCAETGPVTGMHFWGSWQSDVVGNIDAITAGIWSNIPLGPFGYSMPDALLWERVFLPGEWTVSGPEVGLQGWFDASTGLFSLPPEHFQYFQINMENIPDPFIQQAEETYWLALRFSTTGGGVRLEDLSGPLHGFGGMG